MNNLGVSNRSQYHARGYGHNRYPARNNSNIIYNQINRQNFSWWGGRGGATMPSVYPRRIIPFNSRVSTRFGF